MNQRAGIFSRLLRWLPGAETRRLGRQVAVERRRFANYASAITAANGGGAGGGRSGRGSWMGMPADEDAANKEYAFDRAAIMQRSQDLDVNNADVGGFHRMRVAQICGSGVHFKHAPKANEIGLSEEKAVALSQQIDRLRKLHSENGGFDSQRGEQWEGKQQERAILTMLVYGSCLIHRVWKKESGAARRLLPLSLELIPGSRISTPYKKMGDPLVSYGVQYTDNHRTAVAGYWVRRVSMTIGNSFVPDYEWDYLPAQDCALMALTEAAGIDQALPLCTRNMRTLRNRGEFIEAAVESARAQSEYLAITSCAPGQDPYNVALDDRQSNQAAHGAGPISVGRGVKVLYDLHGQETKMNAAHLPEPDFQAFWDITDQRVARGFNASVSSFTRKVLSSFAGGRMERQQDDPILAQYALILKAAWHRVNGWFLEAIWLSGGAGAIELPGYTAATAVLWNRFRAEFPEVSDINPQDTAAANETNLMLRKTSPQRVIEKGGGDPREILDENADWWLMSRETEKRKGIPEGSLDVLFRGRSVSTFAGDDIGAPKPADEPQPGESPDGESPDGQEPSGTKSKSKKSGKNRFTGIFNQA